MYFHECTEGCRLFRGGISPPHILFLTLRCNPSRGVLGRGSPSRHSLVELTEPLVRTLLDEPLRDVFAETHGGVGARVEAVALPPARAEREGQERGEAAGEDG